MKEETHHIVALLEKANWFASVGEWENDEVFMVSSWEEALKFCSNSEWENLKLEAIGEITQRLSTAYTARDRDWNTVVTEIKQITVPLVERKTTQIMKINDLPKSFQDHVNWDVLHIALEVEFADIVLRNFYTNLFKYYISGHFPCGWDGNFPDGRIVIY